MPLYTDPGYSYYSSSGGSMYSPYYSSPLYGSVSSSSSSPYAPYSSTYNRSYSGTYSLPSTSRSARYTTMVSSYQPKLSTITESPLNRSNFIPLTRIKSPKISSYTPSSISTAYIPTPRSTRLKTINTADIDVSATSRYGKHHHMEDRKDEEEKPTAPAVAEVETASSVTNNTTDSDKNSGAIDPNSPFMPRIDGTDTGHVARSTIKRNRAVVRLSIMRSRSKESSKLEDTSMAKEIDGNSEPNELPSPVPPTPVVTNQDSPEKSYIEDQIQEQSKHMCVTDMVQSQSSETSLSEVLIEVDPITHAVRRLSIPLGPTFHDICEDISSDKIDDDLNAGELRRRASLIQEQEIEIINELQKSQSGSFQVIHLERNVSQEDCRKSRKSKKTKKLRHKITANVEIINPPLTPVIQQTIEEEYQSATSPVAMPKFTFNIEEIEEHKVFKLPKKRVKSIKTKKAVVEEKVNETQLTNIALNASSPLISKQKDILEKEPIRHEDSSEVSEDFRAQIEAKDKYSEIINLASPKNRPDESFEIKKNEKVEDKNSDKPFELIKSEDAKDKTSDKTSLSSPKIPSDKTFELKKKEDTKDTNSDIINLSSPKSPSDKIDKKEDTKDKTSVLNNLSSPKSPSDKPFVLKKKEDNLSSPKGPRSDSLAVQKKEEPIEKVATPKPIRKITKSDSTEDFWSQIGTRETLYMNKRKKTVEKSQTTADISNSAQIAEVLTSIEDVKSTTSNLIDEKTMSDTVNITTDKSEDLTKPASFSVVKDQTSSKLTTTTEKTKIEPTTPITPQTPKSEIGEKSKTISLNKIENEKTKLLTTDKSQANQSTQVVDKSISTLPTEQPTKKPNEKPKILTDQLKKEQTPQEDNNSIEKTLKDSPTSSSKSKNSIKTSSKKKSSPKNSAKEEITQPLESNNKTKAKSSASSLTATTTTTTSAATNEESISSTTKISSGSGAKSPDKRKSVKIIKPVTKQQSITKSVSLVEVTSTSLSSSFFDTVVVNKEVSESKLLNKEKSLKEELQKPSTTTATQIFSRKSTKLTTAKSDIKSSEQTGSTKPEPFDKKLEKDSKQPSDGAQTNLNAATSPPAAPTSSANETKAPETQDVTHAVPLLVTPNATTPDVSVIQVQTTATKTTTTESSSQSITTAAAETTTKTTATDCSNSTVVLGSGSGGSGNNLSKFATVSNLAQYLLDVDADLEDYIPSSAEESDSSSDSYSGDGSLSASMKKKNKQLKKKAKEAQQAFDPNKKIKIDTKKKCYVKEEAPRYPLVATPRPLWKREKIVYEESSNSSSEETESESESSTSDEYEDELCPKDAIIRMSTCSNDSGFDGGTTPSSPKKVLDCDVNCHKKCEHLTANLCGVNQKLIVEALACVKRGARETRDSPCSPLSLNPAFKIEANEDETSYTYLQFQKTGRITAPATTIPRFKKYSVEDFNFLAVLGKGSFGKVLLAELRNTDFYYAVKCLKKDVVLEDDDVECTLIERKVLALGTKHPYLCHLFCTFQTESHLFFVMEYLNGGDLMFHIQESGRFPEDRARFYGAEIISGLKFLHKKGIIYRDLKLDNVLLDFDGHVRIADFGMCKLQIYLDKTADSFCGTPDYMAPEIIKGDKYNQNVDWWSFGVLLYEMLIGQSPFSGCDEDELFWSICNEIPWFPVYITLEATSILKGLLEKDYTRRVGSQYSPAGDICDHIFFKDIDWGLLEKRQLPPPFKPQVKHPLDTQYFDRSFTRERVRLTPIDKEILQSMDQEQFQGFSYTNPNATLD